MAKAKAKSKSKTGIYHPPKKGMPYRVVTVGPDGVTAIPCQSKDEARILASKKTLKSLNIERPDLPDEVVDAGC
jgi:hypothetical protein